MTKIVFVQATGARNEVEAVDGQSVMHAAISNLVPGIVAECGGELSCATCHVYIDEQWVGKIPERTDDETNMLEVTSEEPTPASRLCCQIRVDNSMEGMVVYVPKTQKF